VLPRVRISEVEEPPKRSKPRSNQPINGAARRRGIKGGRLKPRSTENIKLNSNLKQGLHLSMKYSIAGWYLMSRKILSYEYHGLLRQLDDCNRWNESLKC
jgi:hypothetical protein